MIIDTCTLTAFLNTHERRIYQDEEYTRAAVLIGLIERDGATHFLLTRRTDHVETHKGQVSFPGGVVEHEEDAIDAALRESHEEIGLTAEFVTVHGLFDDFKTPTGFIITPVIASVDRAATFTPNDAEVARVFTAPVSLFTDDRNARIEKRWFDGKEHSVYFYDYDEEVVWGVTAYLIRAFIELNRPAIDAGE